MSSEHRRSALTAAEHGPGMRWLAERGGCTPAELLADPRRLLAAVTDATGYATELAARLRSDDESQRAVAERERAALAGFFAGAPEPGEQFAVQDHPNLARGSRPAAGVTATAI